MKMNNMLLPLEKIADNPLYLHEVFGDRYKVFEVEVGFSNAHFLREYANANPKTALLGIEKKLKYFRRGQVNLERKLQQNNVKIINYDAYAVVRELIPLNSVDVFHFYFPDPWPKKRHRENRLLSADFLLVLYNRLKKCGVIQIATDHNDYAFFIKEQIKELSPLFEKKSLTSEDRPIKTKWEKRKIKEGCDINYFCVKKL